MKIFLKLFLISLLFEYVLTWTTSIGYTLKLPYIFGIILLVYFFTLVLRKKIEITFKTEELILFLFVLSSFATVFWSIDKAKTLTVSTMLLFVSLTFYALRRLINKKEAGKALNFFVMLGFLSSLFALYQFFGDALGLSQKFTFLNDRYVSNLFSFPRVQSTFFEPGYYANFLFIPFFLSIYYYIKTKEEKYLFLLFFNALAFFLTLSRSGFYSLLLGFGILFFTFWVKKEASVFKKIIAPSKMIFASFLIALLAIWSVSGSTGINNYFNQTKNVSDFVELNDENKELVTRSYTMKVAFLNFKEHPFGIGTGAFGSLPEFQKIREEGNPRQTVNSLYPEILVESGFIALLLFIAFIVYILYLLIIQKGKNSILSLFLGVTTLAIFFQFVSFSTVYLVYIWVFLALALRAVEEGEINETD